MRLKIGLFDFFRDGSAEPKEQEEQVQIIKQENQLDISFVDEETALALRGNAAGERGVTLGERAAISRGASRSCLPAPGDHRADVRAARQ